MSTDQPMKHHCTADDEYCPHDELCWVGEEDGTPVSRPVSIGWVGDVHSGTLTCNACGWQQFTSSYCADDWEMHHRADHGEETSAFDSLDQVIREMTVSTSPANHTITVGDGDLRALFATRPLLLIRLLAERHPDLLYGMTAPRAD